ncbi:MAG TPA: 6-hydroxymethylpterin diphosphokinase MptE-like protein [Rectinemataceae bacterium]|nr:6-hydroxymethylpterin diphosphokinase MptE-like protein [Rectinemataceae bacterium]
MAEVQPGLAAFLSDIEAEPLDLVETANGGQSARRGGRWLHSSRDPRGEARRVAASALRPGSDTVLVFGAGLGWTIEAALALPGVEKVLVCEADPAKLAALLASRDLRAVLADRRLSWMLGGDPGGLLGILSEFSSKIVSIVGLASLQAFDKEWYEALSQAYSRWLMKEEINANTLARFGRLWVRNLARNAGHFAKHPGIDGLAGVFVGMPALVLAAGPSLDEILPFLAEIRGRCLLVAVDTALRSLLGTGIEPDFLLVVDPQYWNWRHVADLSAPTSYLVTEPAVWPPVLRRKARASFLAESLFPLGRALAGSGRGLLGAGGSVATSAWDFARHLGCAPIYIAGLDLGYPEGRTHAKASLFEQRALASGTRLQPSASVQTAALFGIPSSSVASNEGGSLLSDERMSLYAWWFEARLARGDAPETKSLAPKGRAIPGLTLGSLEELRCLSPCRKDIEDRLELLDAERRGTASKGREALQSLLEGLSRIEELASRGMAAAARGRELLGLGAWPQPELAALSEIDEELHSSAVRDVVGFLLPPLRELFVSTPSDLAANLATSENLYSKIAASAREHIELLGVHSLEGAMDTDDDDDARGPGHEAGKGAAPD